MTDKNLLKLMDVSKSDYESCFRSTAENLAKHFFENEIVPVSVCRRFR